jgi:MFS family permease
MNMAHYKRKNNPVFNRIFGDLEGNALDMAIYQPLWAIFGSTIFFYQPLYMKALGVSEVNMGVINSVVAAFYVVTSFLSGPITDKFGRRKTLLIFDLICWSGAMVVWAIARNFWYFLAAALLNSAVKISGTAWTCLAVEDTPEDKRIQFFSITTIINVSAGMLTLLVGFFINSTGIIPAMRIAFSLAVVCVTLMVILRHRATEETKIGKEIIKLQKRISFKEKASDYYKAIKYMITRPITVTVLVIMILTNFQLSFQFFTAIYLKEILNMSAFMTAIYPVVSAVVNLYIYFYLLPKLMRRKNSASLLVGMVLFAIGSILFLFTKPGAYILLIISIVFSAAGTMLTNTFRDTLWNNVIGEGERANIYSACQGLVSIIAIPSGIIAGELYHSRPIYPFIASAVIFIICIIFGLRAFELEKRN